MDTNKIFSYVPHALVGVAVALGTFILYDIGIFGTSSAPKEGATLSSTEENEGEELVSPGKTDEAAHVGDAGATTIFSVPGDDFDLPDLDRFVIVSTVSSEKRIEYLDRLTGLSKTLKEDPSDYHAWLELASYRKTVEDYEGARMAWEYMTTAFPRDRVAYANLGNLYHFYLTDFPKAEKYMLAALVEEPLVANSYLDLYNLYTLSYAKKRNEAPQILVKGIEAIEDSAASVGLMLTLGEYYAAEGEKEKAREQYEKVREVALMLKNSALDAQATAALAELEK